MAKSKSIYVCSECGFESVKWYGKCSSCGQWNTMHEEIRESSPKLKNDNNKSFVPEEAIQISKIDVNDENRYSTGIKELDRVLGGGIVKGSLILLGGDPGIGKSTILLQACQFMSTDMKVLYISGEESKRQIKLRASRLGVDNDNIYILTETDAENISESIKAYKPDIVIIDSIQTVSSDSIASSPGSVTQVRECTSLFMRLCKPLDISVIIVGHVNKAGAIAGPKVLEHVVDAVLYFEGDRQMPYRILRAVKNRYGSTNEIGVFEMSDRGLKEVQNPSLMLLSGRLKNVSGACVTCVMEGSRPILAEVQSLVTSSGFGNPRRMSAGFDYNRIYLILAVLEKRAGFFFSHLDVYINIVGGLKLDEPSVDLSVCLALISSLKDAPINENTLAFGEVGLSGEIRSVSNAELRVTEATRLGFTKCIIPFQNLKTISSKVDPSIELIGIKNIHEAFKVLSYNNK